MSLLQKIEIRAQRTKPRRTISDERVSHSAQCVYYEHMAEDLEEEPIPRPPLWAEVLFYLMVFSAPCVGAFLLFKGFVWWGESVMGWKPDIPDSIATPMLIGFGVLTVLTVTASVFVAIVGWILMTRNSLTLEQVWNVVHQETHSPIIRWLGQHDRRIVEYLYRDFASRRNYTNFSR